MFARIARLLFLFAVFALVSCAGSIEDGTPSAREQRVTATLPDVRISELHYDNSSTDVGEAIEISAPAGTDLSGWQIVLYNGDPVSRGVYSTIQLSGAVPATCGTRGVVFVNYPTNGIQNGAPDGIALVNGAGNVVEFLSYEGTFVAAGGPAAGMASLDIGVSESGADPIGWSLQRKYDGSWMFPQPNTFGSCNDLDPGPPPAEVASVTIAPATSSLLAGSTVQLAAVAFDANGQPIDGIAFTWTTSAPEVATVTADGLVTAVSAGTTTLTATAPNGIAGTASVLVNEPPPSQMPDVRFSEIHYDNFGSDTGEAIEIEGPAGTDLTGWQIVLYNGNGGAPYQTTTIAGTIPDSCGARGVLVVSYPADGIQNGSPDGLALVDGSGNVVEFLSYEGSFTAVGGPANGLISTDIGAAELPSPVGQSLQRDVADDWHLFSSSFALCNPQPPPPGGNTISFTGRTSSDPALPVGFQDQLFATVRDPSGLVIPMTVVWSSVLPEVASIDQNGVITALNEGSAVFRATTGDGSTTATYFLPTRIAVASTTASYAGNAEFGEPTDADPSDDYIVRHAQYTASYNPLRGTPNWVSYDLEETHFGPEDRCDCFTFDPALPASFTRYTTADYTGASAFHGYGIDRGHLVRSFDRTSASLDNAFTFYFSNIVPQAADLNQGPWAAFETYLGDLARQNDKEVYIVSGVAGTIGTLKDEGKIVIPARTWKVAVIMPRDHGLNDVVDYRALELIAVSMPNTPGIRNVSWQTYETTVDAIEADSGYDLLALLPDHIEAIVEAGIQPPFAVTDGPYAADEGGSIAMSAAASFDPNGSITSYMWDFGDSTTAEGSSVVHAYAQDGEYTVHLVVLDNDGLSGAVTTTVTVHNVAPSIVISGGATLLPGELYTAVGAFSDPGADAWTATVDYGDGGGVSALELNGSSFSLSHTYEKAGSFTVTVAVFDDDVGNTVAATVTVLTPEQAIVQAIALVDQLVGAQLLSSSAGKSLKTKLNAALKSLSRGNIDDALQTLQSVVDNIDALVQSGKLTEADAAPLRTLVVRVIRSLSRTTTP